MKQIKRQRLLGVKGPITLTTARRKRGSVFVAPGQESSSDDDDSTKGFSQTLAQIAWQKDIDLTKGHAFITDPDVIEKHSPRMPQKSESEKSSATTRSAHSNQIPNGKPKMFERTVKKPAGTPKASPASSNSNSNSTKNFSYNRVSPLTLMKQQSPTDESSSDLEGSRPLVGPDIKGMSIGDISLHGGVSYRQPRPSVHFEENIYAQPPRTMWEVPKVGYKPSVRSDDSSASAVSIGSSSKISKQSSKSRDSVSQLSQDSSQLLSRDSSSQVSSQNMSIDSSKPSSTIAFESPSYRRHHKQKKSKRNKNGSRTSSTTSLLPLSSEPDSKESEL